MSKPSFEFSATGIRERLRLIHEDAEFATAWIVVRDDESVLADFATIMRRSAAGESLPLKGMTFAVKDNMDVAGLPTTAGFAFDPVYPEESAAVVQNLLSAGALLIGKTNLDQFATGLVGTRSPFGVVPSVLDPDRVSGGSSSGSAVAVARGHVDFALGTDTAGSGRVPAAFNGIVGIKPSLGLISNRGVVPACESYDSVSIFAADLALASKVFPVVAQPDRKWKGSRSWCSTSSIGAPASVTLGIPDDTTLGLLSDDFRESFISTVEFARQSGFEIKNIDFSEFIEAGRLLYGGGLVAERYAAYGERAEKAPEYADPSVLTIVQNAKKVAGWETVRDVQRLRQIAHDMEIVTSGVDALLMPTTVRHPYINEVQGDPIAVNTQLGAFTNFVNLLDLCAVAVTPSIPGLARGYGATVVARSMEDEVALEVASAFTSGEIFPYEVPHVDIAFFGAHMRGETLNYQIAELGARFRSAIMTAQEYSLFYIDGTQPRASLRSAEENGRSYPGEIWSFPPGRVAEFLRLLPAGAAIGPVDLADGDTVLGFLGTKQVGSLIPKGCGWREFVNASNHDSTTLKESASTK